jgi:HEAT repeat protein
MNTDLVPVAAVSVDPEAVELEAKTLIQRIHEGEYDLVSPLIQLGQRKRRSTGPRGTLLVEAPRRLSEECLLEGLLSTSRHVADETHRGRLIIALGEWGDGRIVKPLIAELTGTSDPNIRGAFVIALGRVGGSVSVGRLIDMMCDPNESDDLRLAAVDSLENLSIHGAQLAFEPESGASCPVKDALRRLESDNSASALVRTRAALLLETLEASETIHRRH